MLNFIVLDVIWSDPEELPNGGWSVSPRGAGFLFGSKVAAEVNAFLFIPK